MNRGTRGFEFKERIDRGGWDERRKIKEAAMILEVCP